MTRLALPALAALALAACNTAAAPALEPIPGVADEETMFYASGVESAVVGDNDVIFVRSSGRWYRVQLNAGCLAGLGDPTPTFSFGTLGTSRFDRYDTVIASGSGGRSFTCRAESVRASAAPPMIDSSSVVPRG